MFNVITLNTDRTSKLELYGYIHKASSNSGMFVLALCYNCSYETKSEQIAFSFNFFLSCLSLSIFICRIVLIIIHRPYYEE